MSAVVSAITSVVSGVVDAVGDVVEGVAHAAEKVVTTVVDTAEKVVEGALKDPIGTIAKVAAVATGQFELLPVISAADTVAHGGSLKDAALSAGIAYIAPTVTSGVAGAFADTAVGETLASAAESTGFDSLPGAVAKGVSTAGLNTAAGLLKGQDFETALAGGVTSGIGAGVGNFVGKEIGDSDFDTGNKGINSLLANAAGAATTAELRGKDVSTAIANSVAPGILGLGAGSAFDSIKGPAQTVALEDTGDGAGPPIPKGLTTLLASNAPGAGVTSDVEDPNAAMKTALASNAPVPANDVGTQQLLNALYPDQQKNEESGDFYAKQAPAHAGGDLVSYSILDDGSVVYNYSDGTKLNQDGVPVTSGPSTDTTSTQSIDPIVANAPVVGGAQLMSYTQTASGQIIYNYSDGQQLNADGVPVNPAETKTTETPTENQNAPTTATKLDVADTGVFGNKNTNITNLVEDTIAPKAGAADTAELTNLGNGIFMTKDGSFVNDAGETVNAMGQKTDTLGNVVEGATTSPVTSPSITSSELSSLAQPSNAGESGDSGSTFTGLGGTLGDQAGDFPQNIENQADGSTKVTEFDGAVTIFNTDGTIQKFDSDGVPIVEITGKRPTTTDSDPLGTFINNLGVDKVNVGDSGTQPVAAVDDTKTPPKEIVEPDKSGTNLTSLVTSLIPNVVKPAVNWVANNPVTAAVGAGALIGGLSGDNTQNADGTNMGNGYGFNWNQNMGNGPQNGVYYGSQMLNPTWTRHAAEGGLMSAPQFIQPTVNNNGISLNQGGDPTRGAVMYAAGGMTYPMPYMNPQMAQGGIASLGHYSDGGRFLKGPGDGMSDDIPATIAGKQPARLANEEFVIPADVVSHLGNGSSEAGSKVLYKMMEQVRKARTGNAKQGKQINPAKFMPKVKG